MKAAEFDDAVEAQIERSRDMLIQKNGAYNPNDDKLYIFKRTAMLRGTTPQGALSGMMAKHTGSIYEMCESGKEYPIETWDEKISDHINYLLLLRAVVEEQRQLGASDEALKALKDKLTGNPTTVIHQHRTPEEIMNNFEVGITGAAVSHHVDQEIYVTKPR